MGGVKRRHRVAGQPIRPRKSPEQPERALVSVSPVNGLLQFPSGSDATGSGPTVEIDSSSLYELLLGLMQFGFGQEPDAYPCRIEWAALTREGPAADFRHAFDELAPRSWLWDSLLFMAWEMRASRQALYPVQFIQRIASTDGRRLVEEVLGCRGRAAPITREIVHQAASGSSSARLKIGKVLSFEEPDDDEALQRFLRLPASLVKQQLVRILEGWYDAIVRPDERELSTRLANEARTKRIIGSSAPGRLLRASAIGLHYLPRGAVKRVLLLPSEVCRPSIITIRFGTTRMFCYPLPEDAAAYDDLVVQQVKMHHALGDRERLRILQSLLRSERTSDSLSQELHLARNTVITHLIVLRDAGIVLLRMDERRMSFEIRPNLPSYVFRSLQALLSDAGARVPPATAWPNP